MTFLQVNHCSNEPFSTLRILQIDIAYFRGRHFGILRILHILQIDIVYIAYFTDCHFGIWRILHILRTLRCVYCVILHCVFYNKPFCANKRQFHLQV